MRVSRHSLDGDPATLAAELRDLQPPLGEVAADVAASILAVEQRGDEAVLELVARHDPVEGRPAGLRVGDEELERAVESVDADLLEALRLAARNVDVVARAQLIEEPRLVKLPEGHSVLVRETAVRRAGIYAPGGRAAYPSSVLMGCVPARVAGVERILLATPPGPDGAVPSLVLAAAAIGGADEVYAVGGGHAIAALALGTETIAPVDAVAGPGNRYVQEAKRQLAGRVAIDGIAGPSELMVALDRGADRGWIALDLCAQAEHGPEGLLVAAADEADVLDDLADRVVKLAAQRPSVAEAPLALVEVTDLDAAVALSVPLAPEHLQLAFDGAEMRAGWATTAGCVFAGQTAATAFGDYVAGSNHILPTGGAGRFNGPLAPASFLRRTSTVEVPQAAARELAPAAATLARAEGFPVHAESVEARFGGAGGNDRR